MPIYDYKCSACGHQKDVLQKISDAPLTDCPACGAAAFSKQITAAGFQLKGNGWYATDFRNGSKKPDDKSDSKPDSKPDAKPDAKPEAPAPDAKPAPAAACGAGGCAACS